MSSVYNQISVSERTDIFINEQDDYEVVGLLTKDYMNTLYLDALDLVETTSDRSLWINKIPDNELWNIANWLLMNLIPESNQLRHRRNDLRSIIYQYYDTKSWSDKQKWFVGQSVIDLWPDRRIENDPRYQY